MADMWTTIAAERGALADDLAGVPTDAWATRSLCADWTVEDVLGHMTAAASTNPPKFLLEFVAAGFDFNTYVNKGLARQKGPSSTETLAKFRARSDSKTCPPGPKVTWLGEVIVHCEDIRRPLGIEHAYPVEAMVSVLDFYKGSNALIGTKKRISEVRLQATDAEWSHGEGPVVEGRLIDLLVAATGRKQALDRLSGDGVAVLASR